MAHLDVTDVRLLSALDDDPRAPVTELAGRLGLARKTVQTRLVRLEQSGVLRPHSARVVLRALGYSVTAAVTARVQQARLADAVQALRAVPEVLDASATTGDGDLTCTVVARDSEDLFRVGQLILECPGIVRTTTSVLVRDLIPYRTSELLSRHASPAR